MNQIGLRIFGRVQGVGYRAWAMQTARRYKLIGWVRNLDDGSVEAHVRGPREAIAAFMADCHAGPSMARVTEVRELPSNETEALEGFHQRSTAPAPDPH